MLASQPQCPQRPCQQYSINFQPRSPVNMLHLPQLPTDPECSKKAPNSPRDTKSESNAPQRPCNSACDSTLGLRTPQTKRLGASEGSSGLYAEFFRTAQVSRGLSSGGNSRIDHSVLMQPLSDRWHLFCEARDKPLQINPRPRAPARLLAGCRQR